MVKEVDRVGLGWQTALIGQVAGWGLVRVWLVGRGGLIGWVTGQYWVGEIQFILQNLIIFNDVLAELVSLLLEHFMIASAYFLWCT